jgi:hypothetical protein
MRPARDRAICVLGDNCVILFWRRRPVTISVLSASRLALPCSGLVWSGLVWSDPARALPRRCQRLVSQCEGAATALRDCLAPIALFPFRQWESSCSTAVRFVSSRLGRGAWRSNVNCIHCEFSSGSFSTIVLDRRKKTAIRKIPSVVGGYFPPLSLHLHGAN